MTKATFSWRNYAKPTPRNLELVAASLRRMVAIIAGTSIVMDANKWVSLAVIIVGGGLDEMKNFFATVAHDVESTTAEFPSGEQIEITKIESDQK